MSDVVPRSISDADLLLGLAVAVGDGDEVDDGGLLGSAAAAVPSPPAQLNTPPNPRPTTALATRSRATKAVRRRGSSLDHQRTRHLFRSDATFCLTLRHPENPQVPGAAAVASDDGLR
jgi:hypothetical protein